MSVFAAEKDLGALNDEITIDIPSGPSSARHCLIRLSGTFVGTVSPEESPNRNSDGFVATAGAGAATVDIADGTTAAAPTAVGVYSCDVLAASRRVRWRVSAYTSGTIRAEIVDLILASA